MQILSSGANGRRRESQGQGRTSDPNTVEVSAGWEVADGGQGACLHGGRETPAGSRRLLRCGQGAVGSGLSGTDQKRCLQTSLPGCILSP